MGFLVLTTTKLFLWVFWSLWPLNSNLRLDWFWTDFTVWMLCRGCLESWRHVGSYLNLPSLFFLTSCLREVLFFGVVVQLKSRIWSAFAASDRLQTWGNCLLNIGKNQTNFLWLVCWHHVVLTFCMIALGLHAVLGLCYLTFLVTHGRLPGNNGACSIMNYLVVAM